MDLLKTQIEVTQFPPPQKYGTKAFAAALSLLPSVKEGTTQPLPCVNSVTVKDQALPQSLEPLGWKEHVLKQARPPLSLPCDVTSFTFPKTAHAAVGIPPSSAAVALAQKWDYNSREPLKKGWGACFHPGQTRCFLSPPSLPLMQELSAAARRAGRAEASEPGRLTSWAALWGFFPLSPSTHPETGASKFLLWEPSPCRETRWGQEMCPGLWGGVRLGLWPPPCEEPGLRPARLRALVELVSLSKASFLLPVCAIHLGARLIFSSEQLLRKLLLCPWSLFFSPPCDRRKPSFNPPFPP